MSRNTGITFLLNRNLSIKKIVQTFEIGGRCLAFKIYIDNFVLLVVGIYAPAQAKFRPHFFDQLYDKINDTIEFSDVILVGDFNCVENPILDRFPKRKNFSEPGILAFSRLKNDLNLEDPNRHSNPESEIFTFASYRNSFSRIDRLYLSPDFLVKYHSTHVPVLSDIQHKLLITNFCLTSQKTYGPSFWKMNTAILS